MRLASTVDSFEIQNASDVVLHLARVTGKRLNFPTEAAYVKRIINNYSPNPEKQKDACQTLARGIEIMSGLRKLNSVRIFKSIESVENFLELQEKNHRMKRHPSVQGRKTPVEYLRKKIREQISVLESKPTMKNILDAEEFRQFLGE